MGFRSIRPSQCAVCAHPERARIELLRAGGASLRSVSEKFGVSKDSVHRHMHGHVSPRRKAELVAGPVVVEELASAAAKESKSLLDYLAITRSVLFSQFLTAAEAGDRPGVANLAGRLLENLKELGRLTGELRELSGLTINNNTLNVIASPEFLALQEGLINIARAHPTARGDIVALLRGLDATPLSLKPNGAGGTLIEAEAAHAA